MAFDLELRSTTGFNLVMASTPSATFGKVCISEEWKDITEVNVCVAQAWKNVIELQVVVGNAWKVGQ